MEKSRQNGITLIALVITIIVLLILAGITINLTIGQDGIITKAQQAGKNYVDAANYENQMLKDFESMTDDILTNVTGTNGGAGTPPAPTEVKVTGITLNKTSATITVGNTETLTATIAPSDATNKKLTWTSDNASVATVSNGVITGVSTGTATVTAAAQDGSGKTATCSVTVKPTLASQITAADYGKTINYSANGVTDWKVFYNDGTNVYIIASDYLDNTKIDTAKTGMTTEGTYQAYWASDSLASPENKSAVATLTNTDNWSQFVDGSKAQSATGGPTLDMWVASWNAKGYTRLYTATNDTGYYIGTSANPTSTGIDMSSDTAGYADILYYPHNIWYSSCGGYWLTSPSAGRMDLVMHVNLFGVVHDDSYSLTTLGVRPVVCLKSGITGTVGTSVSMD